MSNRIRLDTMERLQTLSPHASILRMRKLAPVMPEENFRFAMMGADDAADVSRGVVFLGGFEAGFGLATVCHVMAAEAEAQEDAVFRILRAIGFRP